MEKSEQEKNAPENMTEPQGKEKLPGRKKWFHKNQIIITALAILIAVAGYINYADKTLSKGEEGTKSTAKNEDTDAVIQDISSLDSDITDETANSASGEVQDTGSEDMETPGEAVLTGASAYMAQARIDREQVRAQNKETLNEIINNEGLDEEERQGAVQSMVEMTQLIEKESAAELLLEAKGFSDVVVNLTGETADVVVPRTEVSEEERAQIEDIVTRKTGIGVENIVISPMKQAEEDSGETGENS